MNTLNSMVLSPLKVRPAWYEIFADLQVNIATEADVALPGSGGNHLLDRSVQTLCQSHILTPSCSILKNKNTI